MIYIDNDIYLVYTNKNENEGIKSNTANAVLVIGFSLHRDTAREISKKILSRGILSLIP